MIRCSMLSVAGLLLLAGFTGGCGAQSQPAQTMKSGAPITPLLQENPPDEALVAGVEGGMLSSICSREQARRQEIEYRFTKSLHDAEHFTVSIANIAKPLNDTDVADVNHALTEVEVARNIDPALFTADELHAYDVRLARAKVAAQSAIERRQEWELQQRNQAAYDWIVNEQRQQELERKRTVEDLTNRLKALVG